MAIRVMVSEWEPGVEIDPFYSGYEAGSIAHEEGCPHYRELTIAPGPLPDCVKEGSVPGRPWAACRGPREPLYMKTSHAGLVLDANGEINGRDDSDFYAVVWNPEKGEAERVFYASTRGWTYPNGAWADATPEVVAAYKAWLAKLEAERRKAAAERAARTPAKGKRLRVVKGRKIAHGVEGECVWYGAGKRFGPGPTPMRVGLKVAGEVLWTDARNVEVVLGEPAAKAA